MDLNSCSKASSHQNVVSLIVVLLIRAVPRSSSGWFVRVKGVCQYYNEPNSPKISENKMIFTMNRELKCLRMNYKFENIKLFHCMSFR